MHCGRAQPDRSANGAELACNKNISRTGAVWV